MFSLRGHFHFERFIALILIAGPWLFGLSNVSAARDVFLSLGLALAFYSIFLGRIPPGIHMIMDVFVGFFLMVAPYFYQYRSEISTLQALLHYVFGLGLWATIALTRSVEEVRAEHPQDAKRRELPRGIPKESRPVTRGRVRAGEAKRRELKTRYPRATGSP